MNNLAHRAAATGFRSGLGGAIDPGAPGWVDALLAFHRDAFGQARMMADPPQPPVEPAPPAVPPSPSPAPPVAPAPEPDRGYPANTALADMTPEQQVAYWRTQSRKHEDAAKARGDYEDVKRAGEQYKTELEALRQAQMSESEKALAAARAEGAQAAKDEATAAFTQRERDRGIRLVDSFLDLSMGAGGRLEADRDRVAPVLKALDKTTFLTAEGDVDTEALNTFINSLASPAAPVTRAATWSAAQGRRETPAAERGVDAGREMYQARRGRSAAKA